jgi:hypothetical protein
MDKIELVIMGEGSSFGRKPGNYKRFRTDSLNRSRCFAVNLRSRTTLSPKANTRAKDALCI